MEHKYILEQRNENLFTFGREDHSFPRRYKSAQDVCTAMVDLVRNNITTTDKIDIPLELRKNSQFIGIYYNKLGACLCKAGNLPNLEAKL